MNIELLATMLDGCEYRQEVSESLADIARDAGLVIVFGASDDLMEFRGAIYDEVDCYGGGTAHVTSTGLLQNECEDDDCPHFKRLQKSAATIDAIWDSEGYSWTYKTEIPHKTFEVHEDGDKYCRGIVFSLNDVPA